MLFMRIIDSSAVLKGKEILQLPLSAPPPVIMLFSRNSLLLLSWLCLLIAKTTAIPILSLSADDCLPRQTGIYVSISSDAEWESQMPIRWMELHWWGATIQDGDYVGIWDHPPVSADDFLNSTSINTTDGFVKTSVRWDGSLFPTSLPATDGECLFYWAGLVQNGSITYSSCFSLHPYWMSDNMESLSSYGIAEVMLPGVHDAGSYGTPDLLLRGNDEVGKWTFTQDETLWQNMVMGVRYFDMRISYYANTEELFFINHGDVRIRPLETYLNQTSVFLRSTNEIIIFDIHSLEHGLGDNDTVIEMLQDFLESYFGDLMAFDYYGSNARLDQFWTTGKRLIVTFPKTTESSLYWVKVSHLWGNDNKIDEFYDYLSTNIPLQVGRGSMWSVMSEFTPDAIDVTLNHWKGLRGAATITNDPSTLWLRREWWQMVNIIAMDYMASCGVIDAVIEINIIRYQCNIQIGD